MDTAAIARGTTILLTTYRRDGTAAASPVSIARHGERAFFRTWDTSWKARRMRRNPAVAVAPASFRGRPRGATVPARARLLDGADEALARRALERRQPILQGLMVPLFHRLTGRRTVHYELLPPNGEPVPAGGARLTPSRRAPCSSPR
jgi:uncharacterized protein